MGMISQHLDHRDNTCGQFRGSRGLIFGCEGDWCRHETLPGGPAPAEARQSLVGWGGLVDTSLASGFAAVLDEFHAKTFVHHGLGS
jgi:hypothetical protein